MVDCLVFGSGGQVASALRKRAAGKAVRLETLSSRDCDIRNAEQVSSVVREKRPGLLINAAAYTAVDQAESDEKEAFAVNCDGVRHIAEAALEIDVPVIHLSTDYVFDGQKDSPYTEEDTTGPTSVYGKSKLAGESVLREATPKHVIMRTAWVFSETGKNFLKTMCRLADERDALTVVGDQYGNPTSADEIARGIFAALANVSSGAKVFGTYHFAGPEMMSWAEFAVLIMASREARGLPAATIEAIPSEAYPTPVERPKNSRLDCSRFTQTFDFQFEPLQQSVMKAIEGLGGLDARQG